MPATLRCTGFIKWTIVVTAIMLPALVVGPSNSSGVPSTMTYQGRLTNANGLPVSGSMNMVFRVYADSVGGNPLWEETYDNITGQVAVDNLGLFEVLLGSRTPIPVAVFPSNGSTPYLEVTVSGEVLRPRKPLSGVPYAFVANSTSASGPPWDCEDIIPNIISSLNGVANDCGNIELVGTGSITVTPEPMSNRVIISSPPLVGILREIAHDQHHGSNNTTTETIVAQVYVPAATVSSRLLTQAQVKEASSGQYCGLFYIRIGTTGTLADPQVSGESLCGTASGTAMLYVATSGTEFNRNQGTYITISSFGNASGVFTGCTTLIVLGD
jgi:hypothetical protein